MAVASGSWKAARLSFSPLHILSYPRLVETGLDLLDFPTMIFYEIENSLYTLMQAARRSWRLGQTRPVEVYWPYYRDTMEHRAVALIGKQSISL